MGGSTFALSIGLPVGAFLGRLIGWRFTFGALSCLSLILIGWVAWKIPNIKSGDKSKNTPISKVLAMPGVVVVLSTTFIASLAVYIAYTYLSPILVAKGIKDSAGFALLLFGIGAVVGIFITGRFIDHYLRMTLLLSIILGAISLFLIGVAGHIHTIFYASIILWGISFGGMPSLLQTAAINTAKGAPEVGSSMTVTVYNIGIFSGAFLGGLLLDFAGPDVLSWSSFILMNIVILLIIIGRKFAFSKSSGATIT